MNIFEIIILTILLGALATLIPTDLAKNSKLPGKIGWNSYFHLLVPLGLFGLLVRNNFFDDQSLYIIFLCYCCTIYIVKLIYLIYKLKYKKVIEAIDFKNSFDTIRIYFYFIALVISILSALINPTFVFNSVFTTFIIFDVTIDLILNKVIYNKR